MARRIAFDPDGLEGDCFRDFLRRIAFDPDGLEGDFFGDFRNLHMIPTVLLHIVI